MHTFSPKSVRMTGGSLPSSSFSRMNPQRMKKFSFLPRTPKREGIFTAYFTGLIYSRVPTLHKLCVTIRTHELQARATVLMQATRNCFLLPTPKREGIFTAYFAGLIYSRVPTLHKLCVTIRTHELQARATVLMQATRKCVFLVTSVSSIHTGEHPYACKQRGNKNFSVTFLSRHTSERLYKCRHRGTLCTRNIQSFLIANFEHKNKSKYFFYISRPHWSPGCMPRHESSQKMA